MNIFYLDKDYSICSRYHCDKHVVKMILEYAQLLSTAHRILDNKSDYCDSISLPKTTHKNHPCSLWTRKSKNNYIWLYNLLYCLELEYEFRYNKIHMYKVLLNYLKNVPSNISDDKFIDPPLCMPEYCKIKNDTVSSYRNYYLNEKMYFLKYKNREFPYWIII